ncbi:SERINE/THREONINE-PROTEIN KINASE WNK WITH NO LYSINE -RELATED [Salix koriyanagi]|uniref:SERINE/THREONINE-PROTEIN KINASE WNK WITH NO LYSINE -RELATED n=1 Tax=Salix koriyanagi TaxID=2511006 RepID=A0A9Q0U465_9ROSI|nr:SERINE/THREONINE-PROTEIN KINASE WNK WITH NO LYSINE -RELATED [Salix koriyanagi]
MDIDEKQLSESTCTGSNNGSPKSPVLEYQRAHKKNESGLMGMKNDDYSASLTLRISDLGGKDLDTAISVASEMVEQLELADHDVAFIAELIDSLQIMRNILPGWKPSSCGSSNVAIADMEDQESQSSVVSEILVQGASSINNRTSEYYINDGSFKGTNGYVTGSELGDTYLN